MVVFFGRIEFFEQKLALFSETSIIVWSVEIKTKFKHNSDHSLFELYDLLVHARFATIKMKLGI